MAKRNAIIRRLPATETIGVIDIIATDKTGTLTQNSMTVEKLFLSYNEEISVTGNGFVPNGEFSVSEKTIDPLQNSLLKKILTISSLCNVARLVKSDKGLYSVIGDPTEGALIVLSEKAGLNKEKLSDYYSINDEIPFNSNHKYRAIAVNYEVNDNVNDKVSHEIFSLGASEKILSLCSKYYSSNNKLSNLDENLRDKFLSQMSVYASQGMRVLGIASKNRVSSDSLDHSHMHGFVFLGFIVMRDPIRPEVTHAILRAHNAGIRVIMKTGDHKETALAIAHEIGLVDKNAKSDYPQVLTEEELLKYSDKEFIEIIKNVNVFARMTPSMKLRIISVLQQEGHIVAMTGDGVNDAPALKKADVGIGMGIIGTDVARESSDIVLADDNFASIVNAIEEGRTAFLNTRHASTFLVTTSIAEISIILSTLFMGLPLPLLATQILYLNLVTDTLNGAALAFEPSPPDILLLSPRQKNDNILSSKIIPFLVIMVLSMVILSVGAFKYFLPFSLGKARTAAFTVMVLTQLFNVFNLRSENLSLFKIGILRNKFTFWSFLISFLLLLLVLYVPFFMNIFAFEILKMNEFFILLLLSSFVFWFIEFYKSIIIKKKTNTEY